jgi:hypothetical protein
LLQLAAALLAHGSSQIAVVARVHQVEAEVADH